MSNLTIIINTYESAPYHHLAHLVRSNPEADIRLAVNRGDDPDRTCWKNCDRNYRDWWRENRHTVPRDSLIVLLEQDVLVTTSLLKICPTLPAGFMAANTFSDHRWYWWAKHVPLLPAEYKDHAAAVVPLAVLFTCADAMDAVMDARHQSLFELDIISELRLGTIANYCGLPLGVIHMPGVRWNPQYYDFSQPAIRSWGIYHAIKEPAVFPDINKNVNANER